MSDAPQPAATPNSKLESLLAKGLDLWSVGEREAATAHWLEAAELAPDDGRVFEYLEAAGIRPPSRSGAEVIPLRTRDPHPWRAEVVELVRTKAYGEALAILYRASSLRPHDDEIQSSIRSIKGHLSTSLASELGGLDGVPSKRFAKEAKTPEMLAVLRLVNGVRTFEDIALASPLGRLGTLRVLLALFPDAPVTCRPNRRPTLDFPAVRPPSGPGVPPERSDAQAPSIAPDDAVVAPAAQAASPARSEFQRCFDEATSAYLARRYDEAKRLFSRCLDLDPTDRRARVSLERLEARKGSSE